MMTMVKLLVTAGIQDDDQREKSKCYTRAYALNFTGGDDFLLFSFLFAHVHANKKKNSRD